MHFTPTTGLCIQMGIVVADGNIALTIGRQKCMPLDQYFRVGQNGFLCGILNVLYIGSCQQRCRVKSCC